jgi:site-specific recombinase XerD
MIVDNEKAKKRKRGVLEIPLLPYYETYHESFEKWLTRMGYAKTTVNSNTNKLRYFFSFLQSENVHNIYTIENHHIAIYNKLLHSLKLSGTYIRSCHCAINNFSRFIEATENYKISFTAPTIEKHIATPFNTLTQLEIEKLFKSIEETPSGMRNQVMLQLLYSCGLRLEEAARVQIKDVDYNKRILYVQPGKTRTGRYVPLTKKVAQILRNYEQYARPVINPNGKYFLVTNYNDNFRKEIISKALESMLEKSPITKRISAHSLRHSIATHLLQQGMELEKIGQFLGHKSLNTTQMYVRMNNELLHETTTKI